MNPSSPFIAINDERTLDGVTHRINVMLVNEPAGSSRFRYRSLLRFQRNPAANVGW